MAPRKSRRGTLTSSPPTHVRVGPLSVDRREVLAGLDGGERVVVRGTYPLPESQLDRFALVVSLGMPDRDAEREIVTGTGGVDVLGDVTDQGKAIDDPTARGNEFGGIALDYHTDGSDLVGLLCLRTARSGGLSCVANAVAIHNELVRTRPDLAEVLYEPLPYDRRGEEKPGTKPYFMSPTFTRHGDRLFVRFIPGYILASQRHPEAPRLTNLQKEAVKVAVDMARDPDFNVTMDLQPGEMQFINNYHVLHGRTAYVDDVPNGFKRHLKRLWLATHLLTDRPHGFGAPDPHWLSKRSVSRIDTVRG